MYLQSSIPFQISGPTFLITSSIILLHLSHILFSPVVTQDSLVYEVQKGDTLNKIARKHNTTAELISKANNLKGSVIRLGQRLKISKAHFSIVVDKSQNILTLKADGEIFKTYRVSTGKNSSTPVGSFKIINKI